MEIKTKFNIGDKVYTIDPKTIKIKGFKVARISAFTTTNGNVIVNLYPKDNSFLSDYYEENKCFSSQEELIKFIKDTDEPF